MGALTGCLTVEQMAPPVGPSFSTVAMSDTTLAILERGREVYVSDCTRCHSAEPINRYSVDRWHTIIKRMGPQSKLDAPETAALREYILAAHGVMSQEPVTR
jgi:mono/diheme cytochrome c family protein